MFAILLMILVTGAVALGIAAVVASAKNKRDHRRVALRKAEAALRRIANGSGNPVLEAQIALDEIDANHAKELD